MPLSNEDLRERLAKQKWTSHNVRLSDEVTTMPGEPDFVQTDMRLHAIQRVLRLLYRDRLSTLRIADLGCLEGGFAMAFSREGATVLGIEARAADLEKAALLKEHFGLSGMELLCADVKDLTVERFGTFDVVLALGILYHIDEPVQWLRQLAGATRGVLIIDSHFAPADEASFKQIDHRFATMLGGLEKTEVGGWNYEGRWYTEYDDNADREKQLWASYSNPKSFWLTKESLLLALMRSGFDLVFEQHDYSAHFYNYFTTTYPRVMFVAIKSAGLL
ncbi:MAG: methyltransferase domain-containing protein [Acidobacteriota bacterium]